jgi:argonaute-like protein implicated in RNA metabolism and viral defense
MQTFRLDTTEVPNDKTTRMILELRELKGGFNIREAIVFKLEEDRQKGDLARPEVEKFAAFIQDGEGKRWLDNAITWIYRRHFTYQELRQLVKSYRTSAGQKWQLTSRS